MFNRTQLRPECQYQSSEEFLGLPNPGKKRIMKKKVVVGAAYLFVVKMSQIGVCEKQSGKSDDNGSELEFTRFRRFKCREMRKEETSCETGEVGKKKTAKQ
uniref:(northern house mosquito) hypothetical protein n=1 Tax=Culex pipiens TaxID=7175 RepID=A0A8D8IP30_CULPI